TVKTYPDWLTFLATCQPTRILAFSTRGTARYSECQYDDDDYLLFGQETQGLPATLRQSPEITRVLRLPMLATSRSLNLANTAATVVHEAWRRLGFPGASQD